MWSDRIAPEKLQALIAQLRAALPAPDWRGARREATGSLAGAEGMVNHRPGFMYLNSSDGARLLYPPLITFSYAFSDSGGSCTVRGPYGEFVLHAPAFDILEAITEAFLTGSEGAVLAGFLSYDLASQLEDLGPTPTADSAFPQFYFGLYDSVSFCASPYEGMQTDPADQSKRSAAVAQEIVSRPDREAFEASVQQIVARIHQGDIFQTNLCRCLETRLDPGHEWELFQRLRAINPAQYEAFIKIDEGTALLSSSPEMFLKVSNGAVESSPIKGTRPRGASPEQDRALVTELQTSEKDRAELAMIVDVTRNDLGRVCETGSVQVSEHASLMSLPTVHHLYSTVQGRMRTGTSLVDLLRAAFPAASITGAPKIEAMRAAMREEGQLRGPCMGAIGWMDAHNMEMCVAIRTAFCSEGRVRYYAGCGITADSIAADEFAESAHKAAAFLRALGN